MASNKRLLNIFMWHTNLPCYSNTGDRTNMRMCKFASSSVACGEVEKEQMLLFVSEVSRIVMCCYQNNLFLNTVKTKEIVVDFQTKTSPQPTLHQWSLKIIIMCLLRRAQASLSVMLAATGGIILKVLCVTIYPKMEQNKSIYFILNIIYCLKNSYKITNKLVS